MHGVEAESPPMIAVHEGKGGDLHRSPFPTTSVKTKLPPIGTGSPQVINAMQVRAQTCAERHSSVFCDDIVCTHTHSVEAGRPPMIAAHED